MEMFWEILRIVGAVVFAIFFLGMCVFVHELGHFLVAKWRGLHIIAFSLGFKKAWGKKINGVDYRIGWIPAGGYVDLPQIDTTDVAKDEDGNELPPAKPLDRLLTAAAGPVFNILFGLLLGCVVWYFGMPAETPRYESMVVESLIVDSPEYRAGLRPGDEIVKFNGENFNYTWNDLKKEIMLAIGEVTLTVNRNGETLEITYQPTPNPYVAPELRRENIAIPFFEPKVPLAVRPMEDSPAERAGIINGDELVSVNGIELKDFSQLAFFVAEHGANELTLAVKRGKEIKTFTIVPEKLALNPAAPDGEWNSGFLIYDNPEDKSVKVGFVVAGSPADKAGITEGDTIIDIDGQPVSGAVGLFEKIAGAGGVEHQLKIKRGGETFDVSVTPVKLGVYGVGVQLGMLEYPSPFRQFAYVWEMSFRSLRNISISLANKLNLTEQQSTVSARNLSGPLGIVSMMYKTAHYSLITGIYFVVFVSFALAIFNLLPLPVLDGGHIFFAAIELIFRHPVPKWLVKNLSLIFIVLLFSAMALLTMLDVMRLVPPEEVELKEPVIVSIDNPEPPADAAEGSETEAQK
ncbi:MAG: site-2 protease family protein [Victivallaceae bacterium]